MTTTGLVALYFVVGTALGVHVYGVSPHARGRALLAAVTMTCLWPLWAPFVFMPGGSKNDGT